MYTVFTPQQFAAMGLISHGICLIMLVGVGVVGAIAVGADDRARLAQAHGQDIHRRGEPCALLRWDEQQGGVSARTIG